MSQKHGGARPWAKIHILMMAGIILADIESPTGEVFGVIFNPHFKA